MEAWLLLYFLYSIDMRRSSMFYMISQVFESHLFSYHIPKVTMCICIISNIMVNRPFMGFSTASLLNFQYFLKSLKFVVADPFKKSFSV